MRVLHVNSSDDHGGAAKAANRLHQGLLRLGVDSFLYVRDKKTNLANVIGPKTKFKKALNLTGPAIDSLIPKIYQYQPSSLFSTGSIGFGQLTAITKEINPDIIHLHWINDGFIRVEELQKIKKPIVWSLHDMWPFTGGCHYDSFCNKFTMKCGQCPVLNSGKQKDLSTRVFKRKLRLYEKIKDRLTLIGLSQWITEEAKKSALTGSLKVVNLPNLIDTELFAPIEKEVARRILGINANKRQLLFGAMGATTDRRKGFDLLTEALGRLDSKDVELTVFGNNMFEMAPQNSFKVNFLGELKDSYSLKLLYNSADVMLVPSRQENLSNVILESLACQTPVVAFRIGGNCDMIDHKVNGYLAEPYNSDDLVAGIKWALGLNLKNSTKRERNLEVQQFSEESVIPEYIRLYNQMID